MNLPPYFALICKCKKILSELQIHDNTPHVSKYTLKHGQISGKTWASLKSNLGKF